MSIENNIPAFPAFGADQTYLTVMVKHEGMTLLDFFAAKALPYCQSRIDAKNSKENAAHYAYDYAEAMLEERKKRIK